MRIRKNAEFGFAPILCWLFLPFAQPLHSQSVGGIANIKQFLKICPNNDAAIAQIRADFEIRNQGNLVTTIPCTEPFNEMDPAQMSTELAILQSLRVMYYMDQDRSNYLPWTTLRLYDWVKSKIAGIDLLPGGSFSCCTTENGKNIIFGPILDTNSLGYYRDFRGISGGIAVIAHEARHVDGFPHVGCCPVGAGACDQTYDENNLSPYGIQAWLYRNWLTGGINVGMFCEYSNEVRDAMAYFTICAQGYADRFCAAAPPAVPNMTLADTPFGACSLRTLTLAEKGVANAASYSTSIWGGTILALFGTGLGPPTAVTSPHITAEGDFDTTLGNTRVLFDGSAAPMIYAYPDQLSAVAPFSLGNAGTYVNGAIANYIEVERDGKLSNIVSVGPVTPTPGIFTIDGSGTGQAAALNADLTVNGPNNPASRGTAIVLYGTGFGQTTPTQTDGETVPALLPLPQLRGNLSVLIDGNPAQVLYGAAPLAIAGLTQINALIPAAVTPGSKVKVQVTYWAVSNIVTIAVK